MEERRSLEVSNQALLSQKKKLATDLSQKRTLQEQIDQKTRQLRAHQSEAVDIEQLKMKTKRDTKEALKKRIALIAEHWKKSEEQRKVCQARYGGISIKI